MPTSVSVQPKNIIEVEKSRPIDGRKISSNNNLAKYIEKAQQVKRRNQNKSVVKEKVMNEMMSEIDSASDSSNSGKPNACKINENKTELISFEHRFKDKKEGTVLLIGDSLARGVGIHLRSQHCMFESQAFGGARIEDITKKVEDVKDENEKHIVVMVGTNNLKSDGTTLIMDKYKDLIKQLKAKRFNKISLVGILPRNDLSNYNNSKRIAMNKQLKDLCKKNEIKFLEIEIDKDAMLDSRGLHLNFQGQDKAARIIFKHSVNYLN